MRDQAGAVARRQVLALGGTDAQIRRRLRRREWAAAADGVYVDHTGPVLGEQQAWVAVLRHWPCALTRESVLCREGLAPEPTRVRLMVDRTRTLADPGVVAERVGDPARWVVPGSRPPRVRLEYAVVKVASSRRPSAAVALLGDTCQRGRSTPARLADEVRSLPRLPRRAFLLEVLDDATTGAYSVLERRFLRDVERAHGLPAGSRQERDARGPRVAYRDVRYAAYRLLVELDGRLGHEQAHDRWRDLDRDLAAALDDQVTTRIGWKQVLEPCRLAQSLALLLAARGWQGTARRCGPSCSVPDSVAQQSPGDC